MVYIVIESGVVLTIAGLLFLRPIAAAFGATGEMLDNCVVYGHIILCALTAFMLQNIFQSFLVTAERPQLGLAVTVAAGVTNMILDFVFIAVFHWGIVGAAAATAASQLIGGLVPLIYFLRPNTSKLHSANRVTNKDCCKDKTYIHNNTICGYSIFANVMHQLEII